MPRPLAREAFDKGTDLRLPVAVSVPRLSVCDRTPGADYVPLVPRPLHDAYVLAGEGDWLVGEGRLDEAAVKYVQANELNPGNPELGFWAGLSLISQGSESDGLELLRSTIAGHPGWLELLVRLSPHSGPGVERARRLLHVGM